MVQQESRPGWAIRLVVGHRASRTNWGRAVELLECGHEGKIVAARAKYNGATRRTCTACMCVSTKGVG
jgi:hypothetical protein